MFRYLAVFTLLSSFYKAFGTIYSAIPVFKFEVLIVKSLFFAIKLVRRHTYLAAFSFFDSIFLTFIFLSSDRANMLCSVAGCESMLALNLLGSVGFEGAFGVMCNCKPISTSWSICPQSKILILKFYS